MTTPTGTTTGSKRPFVASPHGQELMTPLVLVLDDESSIHSALRLRLRDQCDLTCLANSREALSLLKQQSFDLCIVDVHMPDMDGLAFIEAAREIDPALGYVVLSGYDSEENLRRAIPLQVLDFVGKPLPDRNNFEKRIPSWVAQTQKRRHELSLAKENSAIEQDLELARIERDVESTASESAREALLQTANLLTTIQALLLSANHSLDPLVKGDARLAGVFRSLQEARRNTEQACAIAEGYFGSAYADRESSPAMLDACIRHAVGISLRLAKAEERRQSIDINPHGRDLAISGLTGIDFLLMLVPVLIQTLAFAAQSSTVQIRCDDLTRLDGAVASTRLRSFLWINRRNALLSNPGVLLTIRANAPAFEDPAVRAWLRGNTTPALHVPSRGLLSGIQKARGLLGIAVLPAADRCEFVFALPG